MSDFERRLPAHVADAIERAKAAAYEPPEPPEPRAAPRARHEPPRAPRAAPRAAAAARREERKARAFRSAAKYELRAIDRLRDKVRAAGGDVERGKIENVSWFIWKMCALVIGDLSGEAGRLYLRQLRNPRAACAIYAAAFGGAADGGRMAPRHRWGSLRARRIVAMGLALAALSKDTRKAGPRSALVRGFGRGTFCALLNDPHDRRPSYELVEKRTIKGSKEKKPVVITRKPSQPCITAVFGIHEVGALLSGSEQVGYFHELVRAGFAYRLQRSPERSDESELYGPSGHPPSHYWVLGSSSVAALAIANATPEALRWSLRQALSSGDVVAALVAELQRARPPDPD